MLRFGLYYGEGDGVGFFFFVYILRVFGIFG